MRSGTSDGIIYYRLERAVVGKLLTLVYVLIEYRW